MYNRNDIKQNYGWDATEALADGEYIMIINRAPKTIIVSLTGEQQPPPPVEPDPEETSQDDTGSSDVTEPSPEDEQINQQEA